jgi:hypothetical protein
VGKNISTFLRSWQERCWDDFASGHTLIKCSARLLDFLKILLHPHPNPAEGGAQAEAEICQTILNQRDTRS